ncbi:MAG TPA: hypothetical protein GX499_11080 [Clostridiales bacterium]|nr:hypothetical protein [Clostridiales bacterium]
MSEDIVFATNYEFATSLKAEDFMTAQKLVVHLPKSLDVLNFNRWL